MDVRVASAGSEVWLLVTTRGDKGTADPDADLDALAGRRLEETAAAVARLGLAGYFHQLIEARRGKEGDDLLGTLIAADGKLIIVTLQGELVLVKASANAFEELARAEVLGSTRQAPALCNGLVYLRDDSEIVCVDLRKK